MTTLTRTVAGRYELVRLLGRGGFSEVFLAEDHAGERRVALKLLARPPSAEELNGARLRHPHIVQLLDAGEDQGTPYLAFEFLEGETLRERLATRGTLPLADVRRLAQELASALDYAHEEGITHNDLKPENIFLTERGVRLLDFGAAGALGQTASVAEARELTGTVPYMAPEVFNGQRSRPESDVYGFGVVLAEALSGVRPSPSPGGRDIAAVLQGLPAEAPGRFREALSRALAERPEIRPHRASELADSLAMATHTTVLTAPVGDPNPPHGNSRGASSRRGIVVAVGVAVAGVFAVGGLAAWSAARDAEGKGESVTPLAQVAAPTGTPSPPAPMIEPPTTSDDRDRGESGNEPKGKAKGRKPH